MFDSNLNEARKAVTEIFESDGKKVSCDQAKNVLIDMAYFIGKKQLSNKKQMQNLEKYVAEGNWKDAAKSIEDSDWCKKI